MDENKQLNYGFAKESLYACTPENINFHNLPYIAHFKGNTKKLMFEVVNQISCA